MDALLPYLPVKALKSTPVSGGDINHAYRIEAEEGIFFLKVNSAKAFPGLFAKEANGLQAIAATGTLPVPAIIAHGEKEGSQYLLLQWLQEKATTPKTQYNFGNALATMHRTPQGYFGFTENNYLGTWLQNNTPLQTWADFYCYNRILPLLKSIRDKGGADAHTVAATEKFCEKLPEIFPEEAPSLLHGDLWGGNYITIDGHTALIDPAAYYGHREMDIAMSRLFGGFSLQFYDGYNEAYPLQSGWEDRQKYAQLYPLLFHAWAFGGGYINRIKGILGNF